MNRILLSAIASLCVLAPYAFSQGDQNIDVKARLEQALKRFPDADVNKDGKLSLEEAADYREKLRGQRKGRDGKKGDKAGGKRSKKGGMRSAPVNTVSGKDVPADEAIQGYNALFMGHSFFKPAAVQLSQVIPDTKVVNHTACIVFAGGGGGAPKTLWERENSRLPGQARLDTGKVEFMALTYYSPSNSAVEDYARWFDYAVAKNPEITFMIALPWGKALFQASDEELAGIDDKVKTFFDSTVQTLRKKYPKNKVIFCPYGLGVYELIHRYKKGELLGVKHIMHPNLLAAKAGPTIHILNDPLGHGSKLVSQLNGLIWLQTIYNYDLTSINKPYRIEGLPDVDLNEIAIGIHKKIAPYNAIYRK